jgi:hypothetical protein
MDRKVDRSIQQPVVQLLGPEGLAADFGQRPVLHLVAAGGDGNQLDRKAGVGGQQAHPRLFGLGKGERRAAGAEAQRGNGRGGHRGLC